MTIYGNIGYTLHATMVGGKMYSCVFLLLFTQLATSLTTGVEIDPI